MMRPGTALALVALFAHLDGLLDRLEREAVFEPERERS
jgi:hypothetical protein